MPDGVSFVSIDSCCLCGEAHRIVFHNFMLLSPTLCNTKKKTLEICRPSVLVNIHNWWINRIGYIAKESMQTGRMQNISGIAGKPDAGRDA